MAGSRIEGQVVAAGQTRGNVILFLFDAADPPPPQGSGRPLSFAFIPEQALYGAPVADSSQSGPFTAAYSFSRVRPGSYLLTGLIDHDGCAGSSANPCTASPDFNPWFTVTDEPHRLDVGGAAVDALTHAPKVVSVQDVTTPVTGVTVSFSDQATFTVDRPAFKVADGEDGLFNPSAGNKVLDLLSTGISVGGVNESQPVFLARFVGTNSDGSPADPDRDGIPDLWPKVIARKVSEADPTFLKDETTGSYVRADGTPPPASTQQVVLGAALVPQPLIAALTDPKTGAPLRDASGALLTVPMGSLKVVLTNAAYDISNRSMPPVKLASVPSGHYALYLINPTGQTWRLPNELQRGTAPGLKLPVVDSQDFVITVQ
jgi:hypothetical protein